MYKTGGTLFSLKSCSLVGAGRIERQKFQMKKTKIIHIDNHQIISDAIRKLVKSKIPGCYYLCFTDTGAAFRYLVNSVEAGESPDLLMTDFSHPGLNGYEFAKAIRQLENLLDRKPIPILLLTMHTGKLPAITRGLKEKVFTNYLSLNTNAEEVVEFVKGELRR